VSKRRGLPDTVVSRHQEHYVDHLKGDAFAGIGKMIPIDQIRPNKDQPRNVIGDLSGLKDSIREKGVLEPLIVAEDGDEYMIISGERRYRAAFEVGLSELPCVIRETDEQDTLEVALIENLQRMDLNSFEEAAGLKTLADRYNLSHNDIARKIGKSRSLITETLTLTYIPEDIRTLCQNHGIIAKSTLLQIARQETHAEMLKLANAIINKGMNREEARKARQVDNSKSIKPFTFRFKPEQGSFNITVKFKKSEVEKQELIKALEEAIEKLKGE